MKKKARLTIQGCEQISQVLGGTDEHMVSVINFDLEIEQDKLENLVAEVKQTIGSKYGEGIIEVGRPINYKGQFNQAAFQHAVIHYLKNMIGSSGSAICVDDSSHVIIEDCDISTPITYEFEIDGSEAGW